MKQKKGVGSTSTSREADGGWWHTSTNGGARRRGCWRGRRGRQRSPRRVGADTCAHAFGVDHLLNARGHGRNRGGSPHPPRSTQHLAVRRVFVGSEPCLVLDCASFCTLYVGALRDSRWPTLSVFFLGNVDFHAKNKKFSRWGVTCPQKQTPPSHRAQKTGWTCSNLALDRLPNPPAKVDVWRISQDFGVSPRILAYHPGTLPTFGISLWHGVHEQWEAVRFDRVKHTGVLCLVQRR